MDNPKANTSPKTPIDQPDPILIDPKSAYDVFVWWTLGQFDPGSPHWWAPDAIYSLAYLPYYPDHETHSEGNGGHNWYILSVNRDVFVGTGADELMWGGGDHDLLDGRGGRDQLFGEWGDDELHGGLGSDLLDGGDQDDAIDGGAGANSLFGGSGDDSISVGSSNDLVDGGEGEDTLLIGGYDGSTSHNVEINLAAGQARTAGAFCLISNIENVWAGAGNDRLVGNNLHNDLCGGAGDDRILGQGGHDTLAGEDGSDSIYGGVGNDRLISSASVGELDILNGGAGHDLFAITGHDGLAIIQDCASGEDWLDLSWYADNLLEGVFAENLLDLAAETPAGLLLTITSEIDPGEFETAHLLLIGLDREDLSAADILL